MIPLYVRYLGGRLVQALIIIFIVVVANFALLHSVPGDIVDVMAGESGAMDAEFVASLREQFGLDQPLPVQLMRYLGNLVTGDLGYSFRNSAPVLDLILERLPATALLVVFSVLFSATVGAVIGVGAAKAAHGPLDLILSAFVLILYATPVFLVGLVMIIVFSVKLSLLPLSGLTTPGVNLTGVALILDIAKHLVMPVVSLSLFYVAIYVRLVRASLLDVFGRDYIRTAQAKGLHPLRITFAHALRNALLPLITMAGLQVSALFGGAVLVETIFGLPGLGRLAFDAVFQRDFPLLLGILLVSSVIVVVVNLAVDLLYTVFDPRVEIAQ